MDILNAQVRKDPRKIFLIIKLNSLITTLIYVLYPVTLLFLAVRKDSRFPAFFLVPLFSFILLSIVRNKLNVPRPYASFAYEPILKREKEGNSFPSRHVFSIFVISTGFLSIHYYLGFFLLFLGVILALCRYYGGVHYLKDVIVGAICGIAPWLLVWALTLQ